jgi:DNA-binding NarL/FixJ family response regulator
MARLNHDALATEVRYALADLTTMSMAELETLAQLLAQKLAVRGVLAIDALDDRTAAAIAETGLRDYTASSAAPDQFIEVRRGTPDGAAVKAALREFAAE